MSGHAREAFVDGEAENHFQVTQLPNGREPQTWITETEWSDYTKEDPHCSHLRNRPPSVVSIFIVPKLLKDTKREAYVPGRVSLGPYHHRNAELSLMDNHKGRAVVRMMKGNLPIVPNKILELEKEIRDSYEENIDCDGETLARMLCLDGCFLIEVLRTVVRDSSSTEGASTEEADKCYDPIFGKHKLLFAASDILYDILMLENQVPFIVLRKLLELELNSAIDVAEKLLFNLLKYIVSLFIPFDFDREKLDIQQWYCHHNHLLGFLHTVIVSPSSSAGKCSIPIDRCSSQCIRMLHCKSKAWNQGKIIPHAVELRNAGIKFKPFQGGIEEIKFEENIATIFLPSISIEDNTERVFRNLIAFEMCKPSQRSYVSCYVSLMDDLIDSEQDVALLRRMGVLTNCLGSDKEVADLFNGLCKGVTLYDGEHVWDNLTEKVNAHYNDEIKVHIEKLVQEHFSSPWKALGLTAAILILLLTVLQTIFTII